MSRGCYFLVESSDQNTYYFCLSVVCLFVFFFNLGKHLCYNFMEQSLHSVSVFSALSFRLWYFGIGPLIISLFLHVFVIFIFVCLFLFIYFRCYMRRVLTLYLRLALNSLSSPCWPQTHSSFLVSAFWVQELSGWATMPCPPHTQHTAFFLCVNAFNVVLSQPFPPSLIFFRLLGKFDYWSFSCAFHLIDSSCLAFLVSYLSEIVSLLNFSCLYFSTLFVSLSRSWVHFLTSLIRLSCLYSHWVFLELELSCGFLSFQLSCWLWFLLLKSCELDVS